MAPDLLDQLPDYEPDLGARGQVRFVPDDERPLDAPVRTCGGCGRPLRPNSVRAADRPGTLAHGAHGLCTGCTSRRRFGRPGPVQPRPIAVDVDVDEIAVDLAVHGDVVPLNLAERRIVVEQLTARQWPAREIARIIARDKRTVVRIRHALREAA